MNRSYRLLALGLCAIALFAAHASGQNAEFKLINLVGDPPPEDPQAKLLEAHFEAAAEIWSSIMILPGNRIDLKFKYADIRNDGLYKVNPGRDLKPNRRILISNTRNWFYDPTPGEHEEFKMESVLARAKPNGLRNAESWPLLEVGYGGKAPDLDPKRMDLLTIILHEIGHRLRIAADRPPAAKQAKIYPVPFLKSTQVGIFTRRQRGPSVLMTTGSDPHPRTDLMAGLAGGERRLPATIDALLALRRQLHFKNPGGLHTNRITMPRKYLVPSTVPVPFDDPWSWYARYPPQEGDEIFLRAQARGFLQILPGKDLGFAESAESLEIGEGSQMSMTLRDITRPYRLERLRVHDSVDGVGSGLNVVGLREAPVPGLRSIVSTFEPNSLLVLSDGYLHGSSLEMRDATVEGRGRIEVGSLSLSGATLIEAENGTVDIDAGNVSTPGPVLPTLLAAQGSIGIDVAGAGPLTAPIDVERIRIGDGRSVLLPDSTVRVQDTIELLGPAARLDTGRLELGTLGSTFVHLDAGGVLNASAMRITDNSQLWMTSGIATTTIDGPLTVDQGAVWIQGPSHLSSSNTGHTPDRIGEADPLDHSPKHLHTASVKLEGGASWFTRDVHVGGRAGDGTLILENGSTCYANEVRVGLEQLDSSDPLQPLVSIGQVDVLSASKLIVDDKLVVGDHGNGTLTIDKSTVECHGTVLIGGAPYDTPSNLTDGEVQVDSGLLDVDGVIAMGHAGYANLNITGSGRVECDRMDLKFSTIRLEGDQAKVIVKGPVHVSKTSNILMNESRFTITDRLQVEGGGQLTLDGGTLLASFCNFEGNLVARGRIEATWVSSAHALYPVGPLTIVGDFRTVHGSWLQYGTLLRSRTAPMHVDGDCRLRGTVSVSLHLWDSGERAPLLTTTGALDVDVAVESYPPGANLIVERGRLLIEVP